LLRLIAGLEEPEGGDILWNRRSILHVDPHLRKFGLMFQDYALFPHLNVAENVAFGLSIQHTDHHHIQKKVKELLGKVALNGFEGRDVLSLSGGEQQRVALARSLAPAPQLLMLDEPMGALDRELKDALLIELRHILKETGIQSNYLMSPFFQARDQLAANIPVCSGYQYFHLTPHQLCNYQIFQGGSPEFHNVSRTNLSARVSILCQNPLCRKAESCPSSANFSSGPNSHTVVSSFR
jgi:ABC-type multidrug transport system ATPase subunit